MSFTHFTEAPSSGRAGTRPAAARGSAGARLLVIALLATALSLIHI